MRTVVMLIALVVAGIPSGPAEAGMPLRSPNVGSAEEMERLQAVIDEAASRYRFTDVATRFNDLAFRASIGLLADSWGNPLYLFLSRTPGSWCVWSWGPDLERSTWDDVGVCSDAPKVE